MVKKIMFLCFVVFILTPFALVAKNTISIPETIKQHCLLTAEGGIEHCPAYRQSIAMINRKLANNWNTYYKEGGITLLIKNIDTDIDGFTKKKLKLINEKTGTTDLFLFYYESYITKLFRQYIDGNSDHSQIVSSFFKKTYFDADQSGLTISQMKLYKGVSQYDPSVKAQITIRNFATHTIDTIEDIYCFASVGDQDLIFPLNVQNIFAKNSITNLVVSINTKKSSLLDSHGTKRLFCTIVYTQNAQEKYSNRGTLEFTISK